ncbi:MAG: hypothetical protein GY715_16205 [Planctomycetes bacterium]|nr:hypothetical protein [Planctomycetota bacterium]
MAHIMSRTSRWTVIAVLLSALCSPGLGESIVIEIDPEAPSEQFNGEFEVVSMGSWPQNHLRLVAYLESDDGSRTEITDSATWIVDGDVPFIAPGEIALTGEESYNFSVRADSGPVSSDWLEIRVHEPNDAPPGGDTAGPDDDDFTPEEATWIAEQALQALHDAGFTGLDGLIASFYDNDYLTPSWMWSVVGPGENGLFVDGGSLTIHRGHILDSEGPNGTVILKHNVLASLAAGEFFTVNGVPTPAMVTLIHEMIHDAIWEGGERDAMFPEGFAQEELIVEELSTVVLPNLIKVIGILNQNTWSITDVMQIRNLLTNSIIPGFQWFQTNFEGWAQLAQILDLTDADGDGIPDFLEVLIYPMLEWLYEWLRDNPWPFLWDPRELFGLFPAFDFPFCDTEPLPPHPILAPNEGQRDPGALEDGLLRLRLPSVEDECVTILYL